MKKQTNVLQLEIQRWTLVKKIPRLIYAIVIFFAALLTIFYYLGWLEPVKTFITKIWPKQ